MTAPARIQQLDLERCAKAAKNAGWTHVHMKIDLATQTIDVTLTDAPDSERESGNPWDRELDSGT